MNLMKIMTRIFIIFILWIAILPQKADAQIAVIELFTTQSCSSCPPADQALNDILDQADPNVIALTCHVTLMDQEDWKDTMSNPLCDGRLKGYNIRHDLGAVQTPQAIINAKFDTTGTDADTMGAGLRMAQSMNTIKALNLGFKENFLEIRLPDMAFDRPADVFLFSYKTYKDFLVSGGQNAGQTITYPNVIQRGRRILNWDGQARSIVYPLKDFPADGYAIIVQEKGFGDILAAGKLERSKL